MLNENSERFSWMGIAFSRPVDWELTAIKRRNAAWQATFADRHHERLSLEWQHQEKRPNLNLMLSGALQKEAANSPIPLRTLPPGWMGLESRNEKGVVAHVIAFLEEAQLMVEAIIASAPADKPPDFERLLSSFSAQDSSSAGLLWQAMGMSLSIANDYKITHFKSQSGASEWQLKRGDEREGEGLILHRIAMPAYWLRAPLKEWLERRPPLDAKEIRMDEGAYNGHQSYSLLTRKRRGLAKRRLRRYEWRRDLAWLCEREQRLYHLVWNRFGAHGAAPEMPAIAINCCRVPVIARSGEGRESSAAGSAANPLVTIPTLAVEQSCIKKEGDFTTISIPLPRTWLRRPPINWLLPLASERRIRLDALGTKVLALCDGNNTVEGIANAIAMEHKLSFREAQMAVAQFLQTLISKRIVRLAKNDQ